MNFADIDRKLKFWMELHADSPKAVWLLSIVSFAESSVLPLPPSAVLLGIIALGDRNKWLKLAILTTVMSVAGGLLGYFVGAVLYDTVGIWIVEHYNLTHYISRLGSQFENHSFVANLIGAFTPIPYKAFTIASGFFSINVISFVFASLVGRGARFVIIAYIAKVFGEHVARSVFKYIAITTIAALVIIIIFAVVASI